MRRLGSKTIIAILTGIFFSLQATGAVAVDASAGRTPWYAAWYLWLAFGIFIILLVSILGTNKERK